MSAPKWHLGIEQPGHHYHYPNFDLRSIECEEMIALDTPDALVLAILCDFGEKPKQQGVTLSGNKTNELIGENEAELLKYLCIMKFLSSNGNLKALLKEEEKMLSQVKLSELPSYEIGMERGLQQGNRTTLIESSFAFIAFIALIAFAMR